MFYIYATVSMNYHAGAHPGGLAVMTGPFVPQIPSIKADNKSKHCHSRSLMWLVWSKQYHISSNIA